MPLLIWTKSPKEKIYTALSPLLRLHPDVEVATSNDLSAIPPQTDDPGRVVFCLGTDTLPLLQAEKVVAKNRTVTSLRGSVIPYQNQRLLISYSPQILDVDYGQYVDLLCDTGTAIRLVKTGKYEPDYGDYQYVQDLRSFRSQVEYLWDESGGRPVDVALDLETIGFDPYRKPELQHPGAYVVSIQVSLAVGTAEIIRFPTPAAEREWFADWALAEDLAWLLSTPKVSTRGANLKFDLHWLYVRGGLECTNFKFDTTLVGSLLDENRSNGLDVHCKIYAPELGGYSDIFDKTVDKSRMDLVPASKLLNYAAGDADATLRVSIAQKKELQKDGPLTQFYVHVLHPAARAFEMVERGGVLVDRDRYKQLEIDLNTEIVMLVHKGRSILGGRIWAKHSDDTKPGGINLTKASMLSDFMFSPMGLNLKPKMMTEKSGAPSTALEHLMMFKDVPEAKAFVSLLSDYASATKTLQTYVTGFLACLRSDGRFHPSYFFFAGNKDEGDGGTNTGRLSCKDPAFQTIPKHTKWAKRIRACFIAPDGYLVEERDYSQGELKVVACIANEETMIAAYLKGMDLHVLTGSGLVNMSYEDVLALKKTDPEKYDSIRQPAKPANFGLLYGQFPEGFKHFAEQNYGVKMTLERATEIREKFFALYPGLPRYHDNYKNFAHKFGHVRSPLGRIRHLPLINSSRSDVRMKTERQAINSPVQGTLSDMLLWTAALEHRSGLTSIAPCFGAIHDAIYNYIPVDRKDEVCRIGREIMENLPFHEVNWKPQLKFTCDVKIGPDMATLKDWKG